MQHFLTLAYLHCMWIQFCYHLLEILLIWTRNSQRASCKYNDQWSNKRPSGQGLKMSYMVAIVFLLLRRMAWTLILGINGPMETAMAHAWLLYVLIIVVETDWKWMLLQTPDWPWLSGRPAPHHRGWWTRWSRTPRPVATAHLGLPDASLPGSATTEDTKRHLWVINTKKTYHSFIVY